MSPHSWNLYLSFGGVLGVSQGVEWGLHLTWLYKANWLFTTLIIQKSEEILTFSWRIQNGCQIHPTIYIPWYIWGSGSARKSAKITFNNNITYYTWQIWALIVEICNCHFGECFWGGLEVSRGLHMTWLYNANWLFTTLIIQKSEEFPIFSWRIQNGCQIHPIIYIPWCIWGVYPLADLGVDLLIAILDHKMSVAMWNCHSWPLDVSCSMKLPLLTTRCQ